MPRGLPPVRAAAQPPPCLAVRRAVGSVELRAAAHLRAEAFGKVPQGRSEYARAAFVRMKAEAEWDALQAKVAGTDTAWQGVAVLPLVATLPLLPSSSLPAPNPACVLPGEADGSTVAHLVVGTLDLNLGSKLPAEELCGRLPPAGGSHRAYLSNVCVSPMVRRQGVAKSLISSAVVSAAAQGVRELYVHVEAENQAAHALYIDCSFELEQEEAANTAHALNRPRRLLLHLSL